MYRYYFKEIKLPFGYHKIYDLVPLRRMAQELITNQLSKEAKRRLKWFDYYNMHRNVSQTCRYFGIARKTFYYWKSRYNPNDLSTLEDQSKAPNKKRQREITGEQESRIVALRKKYIRYGKEKLVRIYQSTYHENISAWKIQKVIEKHNLYYNPIKTARTANKRRRSQKKKRIQELKKKKTNGFLLCLDVIVIYWDGAKRYIFTAIDNYGKISFARMYSSKSSLNAEDFLRRLYLLLDGNIENIGTDNGGEFHKYFERAIKRLGLSHYWSREHTPKDNPVNERFNRTLEEEFIQLGNFTTNIELFNHRLTEWLIEYNFRRPHQTLGYLTPMEFHYKHHKVLPMYSSSTRCCL